MRVATVRRPTIRVPAGSRAPLAMVAVGFGIALWSTIELGPVSGVFPLVLLLACTGLYVAILNAVVCVHAARQRVAQTRPLDPRAEHWLRVARWAAVMAGALFGAYELTAGGDVLSSASAIGCLIGAAVASVLATLADVGLRAIAAPRPAR